MRERKRKRDSDTEREREKRKENERKRERNGIIESLISSVVSLGFYLSTIGFFVKMIFEST